MDYGQMIFMYSRLILGAAAAFLAIILWSKTHDIAWMLIVMGIIAAYIETVYATLELAGITAAVPLPAALLTLLRMVFFIAALLIMVLRRYKTKNTEEI